MKSTPKNQKLYWDSRAREYPTPFDPATAAKTRRILAALRRLGADLRGLRVLDIGCGTGVYALWLAANGAASTVGTDSSRAMLRVFERERRLRGIKNASCFAADWAKVPAEKVAGRFDAALASMTMAVKGEADLLRMESAVPGGLCVYIGWAGRRRNALMEKVYAGHGLEYKAPEGAELVLAALKRLGRRPKARYISDSWTRGDSVAGTLAAIAVNMKVNGVRLKRAWTLELLKQRARGGVVPQRTSVRKALLVWRAPRP